MDYIICLSDDHEYVILTVRGVLDRSLAMRFSVEVTALGKTVDTNRFLFDFIEARNEDTLVDQYNFAYVDMLQSTEVDRSATVAIVVAEDDHAYDFVETVLRNAGFHVTLFTDRQMAIDYLLNTPRKQTSGSV